MATTQRQMACGPERIVRPQAAAPVHTMISAWQAQPRGSWWAQRREASLNWLALGMLLAAWNAADNGPEAQPRRRPDGLRGYSSVSVRAATMHSAGWRTSAASTGDHGNS